MIAEGRPERRLQPVVRLLALWVRQMLVEGTPQSVDPSDRTIETYLTRIGPTLVEWFGSSALVDMDDVELEERSEEHTSELQSLMRISYAVFCLKKKKK